MEQRREDIDMRTGHSPQFQRSDPCLASGGPGINPGEREAQIAQNQVALGAQFGKVLMEMKDNFQAATAELQKNYFAISAEQQQQMLELRQQIGALGVSGAPPLRMSMSMMMTPSHKSHQHYSSCPTMLSAPTALSSSILPVDYDGSQSQAGPIPQIRLFPSTICLTIVRYEAEVQDRSIPAQPEFAVIEADSTAQMPKQQQTVGEFDGDPLEFTAWLHNLHSAITHTNLARLGDCVLRYYLYSHLKPGSPPFYVIEAEQYQREKSGAPTLTMAQEIYMLKQRYELPQNPQRLLAQAREYKWNGKLSTLSQLITTIQNYYTKVDPTSNSAFHGVDAVIQ